MFGRLLSYLRLGLPIPFAYPRERIPVEPLAKPPNQRGKVSHQGQNSRMPAHRQESEGGVNIRDEIIGAILGHEGGYVDDPRDSGGETNWGITIAVAREYGYMGSMRHMTKRVAIQIYVDRYWNVMNLDNIANFSHQLAYVLFDIGVNAGVGRSSKYFQRCLNVLNNRGKLWDDIIVDGDIGGKTMAAYRSFYGYRGAEGNTRLASMMKGLQMTHYITLAERREKDEAFVYGWAGRAMELPKNMEA